MLAEMILTPRLTGKTAHLSLIFSKKPRGLVRVEMNDITLKVFPDLVS